ncbi:MAG: DUF928 domain-containing protein [Cyanobacteria bacterium P01_A01_bin.114]
MASATSIVAVSSLWGISLQQPAAAYSPQVSTQTLSHDSAVLLSNRLRGYRFRVRSSRYRRGGIARGETCPSEVIASITPVSEDIQATATTYLGTSAHPTFFVNVPELPETTLKLSVQPLDLSAVDANGELDPDQIDFRAFDYEKAIYEAEYVLASQMGGVVGLRVPSTAPPLELGTYYLWQVSVFCQPDGADPMAQDDGMILDGGIMERVEDTATGSADERLTHYLSQGIWQDALSLVAAAYHAAPNDGAAAQDWADLMEIAGLPAYQTQPILAIQEGTLMWSVGEG